MTAALPPDQLRQYIVNCFAEGFTQRDVAESLGMDEGAISKLCSEHGLQPPPDTRYAEIDNLYDEIERTSLQQLKKLLPLMGDPMKLMRVAAEANSAKRRSQPYREGALNGKGQTINLTLPKTMAAQFIFNAQGQAVGYSTAAAEPQPVDGEVVNQTGALPAPQAHRPLVTANNALLQQLAAEHKQRQLEEKHEQGQQRGTAGSGAGQQPQAESTARVRSPVPEDCDM